MTNLKIAATKSLLSALYITILGAFPATASNTKVQIAGHTVIVNRAGISAMSVDQRTATIQRELDNALLTAADHSAASVKVKRVKGQPVITLGGITIVNVDRANAKIAGTTPLALANKWSAAMRRELGNTGEVEDYIANLGSTTPSSSDTPSAENYLVNSGGTTSFATSVPAPASPPPAGSRGPALGSPYSF